MQVFPIKSMADLQYELFFYKILHICKHEKQRQIECTSTLDIYFNFEPCSDYYLI